MPLPMVQILSFPFGMSVSGTVLARRKIQMTDGTRFGSLPTAKKTMTTDAIVPTPTQPPASQPPSTLRKLFVGREGLRTLWSFILFLLILAALVGAIFFIGHKLFPGRQPKVVTEITLKFELITESILAFITLLSTWTMAKIERRGRSYGYGGANKLKQLVSGLCWGIVLISLLVLSLWMGGFLVFERRLIFGADVLRYGVLWLIGFFLVGVFEESITRGFILYTLTRGLAGLYQRVFKTQHSAALGFWSAAVILSVIFLLGHTNNPGESPVGLLSVFLAGMFFSLSIWRTGSIWWAIGMHATWDWGQSFLFGVADSGLMAQHHLLATHPVGSPVFSGGTTGPEGSIFIVGVLAVGCVVILTTLPRGRYYDGPPPLAEPQTRLAPAAV